ncbi:amylo-alpha-1,6-glucosidase [Ruegeria jejuensis]|uniref:amylo-alpha-1,6-glucosidase n=1 Tax=Ruegeria jejuensis TaxID=3233338 RepID=UPI00355C98B7
MSDHLIEQAKEILRRNDRGAYSVPTHGLYPFQWNWDSALSALGFSHFDEARAWTEIQTLFEHQWEDGMVPHIIFHEHDEGYFPGPDIWGTGAAVPTSGITQPPVAGFAASKMFDRASDTELATKQARALLPRIHAWHKWFFECRDPKGTGLVALIHPWESGRDNSVDWDDVFERVPTDDVQPFQRRDLQHADPDHRPTDEQYLRYIWLVQRFRSLGWDNVKLHDASPFQVVDPGFNAILQRSCAELAVLADRLNESEIAAESRSLASKGRAAMDTLWNDKLGQYLCFDRTAGKLIDSPSIAGLLAVFADTPEDKAKAIAQRIGDLSERCEYLVPSHDPDAAEFDGRRYWRGPVWLIVNYMIADGLYNASQVAMADRIRQDCLRLIHESGFAEYYDPTTGAPCGGTQFTWTAAMVIEILKTQQIAA